MAIPVNYYSFVGGINTEANPLNFPENTLLDADNVILLRDGSIRSRLGIDYESGYARVGPIVAQAYSDIRLTPDRARRIATGLGTWPSVGGNGELEFTVVQFGNVLYFHDSTSGAISDNQKEFQVDLDNFKISSISYEDRVELATGNGLLFVAGPQINPFYIEYDPGTDSVTTTQIDIKIRDFEGVEDNLPIDLRPVTLSTEHKYNLRNQGWPFDFLCATDKVNANEKDHAYIRDPIEITKDLLNVYPSNADIIMLGYTVMANGTEAYWPHELRSANIGTTPAPKGRFVVDAFNIDRTLTSGIPGLPKQVESSRPSTIAFYAGRVWYAGLDVGLNTGKVYFSQLVEDNDKINKCYQEADPTSESVSDLVDTDGGVIPIPDAGQIHKLLAVGRSILVFATNGIWEITGIDGSFIATGYSINKIGEQGIYSPQAVVPVESDVYFIGKDGLYVLTKEQFGVNFQIQDLSSVTIQSLLNSISPYGKDYALGVYDSEERRITWFFNNTEENDGTNYRFLYNRALVYDTILKAFYPLTISTGTNYPIVGGVVGSRRYTYSTDPTDVEASVSEVQVGGASVYLDTKNLVKDPLKYKFLSIWRDYKDGFYYYTFSELKNENFRDWENFDRAGITFPAYAETGYQVGGNAAVCKQIQYVYCYLKRTETGFEYNSKGELVLADQSSCLLSTKWDWADASGSGKWSTPRQIYRYKRFYQPKDVNDALEYGKAVIVSKSKIRGRGQSVRFRFENEPGKNFHLYGWQVYYNANAAP